MFEVRDCQFLIFKKNVQLNIAHINSLFQLFLLHLRILFIIIYIMHFKNYKFNNLGYWKLNRIGIIYRFKIILCLHNKK